MPPDRDDPDQLIADAAGLGVAIDSAQAQALLSFRAELLRWNRAFNLISRRDTGRVMTRHLLDSLSVAPWLVGESIMDLGTGAGLPGVPLAVARPDLSFTLVDRSERKIRFVRQAARLLGLDNLSSWRGDVRGMPPDSVFDTVVCRAVAGVGEVWELAGERLRPGGRMLIMHRSQSADSPLQPVPGELSEAALRERIALAIPGLAQTHELVVLERLGRPDRGGRGAH